MAEKPEIEAEIQTTKDPIVVKFKETEGQAQYQNLMLTYRFGTYGLLGLVMNLPWLLAFANVFSDTSKDLWYAFVVFHGFQVTKNIPKSK